MSLVSATNLVKRYGSTHALSGFDLSVSPGRIVGLVGANGSGKTTALKSLMGLCSLDSGTLSVLDLDPQRDRVALMKRASYIADVGILPRWMRVRDLLQFVDSVHPAYDAEIARRHLNKTNIAPTARIKTLSKGMTAQLHLAIVMACQVELMVLDEPTLGLDILYRQAFYDSILNDYFTDQRSIIITTHEIAEVEHILTDVVFVNEGRSVLTSATEDLSHRFCKVLAAADQQSALSAHKPLRIRKTLDGVTAIFDGADQRALAELGTVSTPSLSDLFVALVGGGE